MSSSDGQTERYFPTAQSPELIGNALTITMKTLTIPFLFILFSCNSLSEHTKQQVDDKVETSKEDMNADVQNLRQGFVVTYNEKLKSQTDSSGKQKLQGLYNLIIATDTYLDSLKGEMDKLDEADINNVESVKTIFLYKGAGDSIINKMKRSIEAAQKNTSTERGKIGIKATSDTLFNVSAEKWKEQTFGLTNSLGASMILYGLQTQLYAIGIKSLNDK